MEKIKSLNFYQKSFLIFMIIMVVVFTVVYPITISKVGFEYKDTILVPRQEHGCMVYSGKIQGQQADFIVSEDKTLVFQYGDKTYGPYTAEEDPAAIPRESEIKEYMTGVELRQGEDILFRGGVYESGDDYWLYNEDGTLNDIGFFIIAGDGIEREENGNIIDPMEPSASTILKLMNNPELTHKGEWLVWFGAVVICVFNALSILFADELFRWHLTFRICDVDSAEPSDWEIAGRYISWAILTITALLLFIMGLQY